MTQEPTIKVADYLLDEGLAEATGARNSNAALTLLSYVRRMWVRNLAARVSIMAFSGTKRDSNAA